jgi:hypothetical protein
VTNLRPGIGECVRKWRREGELSIRSGTEQSV